MAEDYFHHKGCIIRTSIFDPKNLLEENALINHFLQYFKSTVVRPKSKAYELLEPHWVPNNWLFPLN